MKCKNFFKTMTAAICAASLLMAGCGSDKAADDTIKIGAIGEMTGGNASYGTSMMRGFKLAVKEINANGGTARSLYLLKQIPRANRPKQPTL